MTCAGQQELHKSTGFQCIFIFCLNALVELSQVLGKPEPSIQLPQGSLPASKLASELRTAIRKAAFDGEKFVSGPDKQLSWASNAWAVLAGVHDSQEEAQKALRIAYESKDSVIANTPYLHHYVRTCTAYPWLRDSTDKLDPIAVRGLHQGRPFRPCA